MKTKFAVYILLCTFVASVSRAQLPGNLPGLTGSGAEYFVGRIEGKPLITVNLLNGVGAPGVYHIPIQTNLSQLLAFAGGASGSADLEDISIRSVSQAGITVKKIDLEHIVNKNEPIPVLQDKDMVMIKTETDYWARGALYIGLVSGLIGIILGSIAIEKSR